MLIEELPTYNSLEEMPVRNKPYPVNDKVDVSSLELGKVYIYDSNMKDTNMGPFSSTAGVKQALGIKPNTSVSQFVNTMQKVVSPLLAGAGFYLISNVKPTTRGKFVVVTNLATGETAQYTSYNLASKALGRHHSMLKKAVKLDGSVESLDGNKYIVKVIDKTQ